MDKYEILKNKLWGYLADLDHATILAESYREKGDMEMALREEAKESVLLSVVTDLAEFLDVDLICKTETARAEFGDGFIKYDRVLIAE